MALSSASTDQDVWDAYDDNAAYDSQDDVDTGVTMAQAFIGACRILLRRRPVSVSVDGTSTAFDGSAIQKAIEAAVGWLALNNTSANGGSVRHLSFRYLRE